MTENAPKYVAIFTYLGNTVLRACPVRALVSLPRLGVLDFGPLATYARRSDVGWLEEVSCRSHLSKSKRRPVI